MMKQSEKWMTILGVLSAVLSLLSNLLGFLKEVR